MPKKVLIIDDDPAILESLGDVLEDEGYTIICLPNAEDIDKTLLSYNIDLLIVDMWLPGKKGIEVAKHIKSNGGANLPIVLISAQDNVVQEEDEQYIDAFIRKPFDIEDLINKINILT
jgi:DNA-binding response OmpR family regulator